MSTYLKAIFIFFIGSVLGWCLELLYRRIYHKQWVNPGFLVGPYLPIYGFGLLVMNVISVIFSRYNLPIYLTILSMGLSMTLIELITGLIFLKNGIRLWDYRDDWLNYKGIICPLYSFCWLVIAGIYLLFIEKKLLGALSWYASNLSFSFVLGIFTGVIILDFVYSTKLYKRIKKFAKDNNIDILYEKLKLQIKGFQEAAKERYSFILPFRQTRALKDYLSGYLEKDKNNKE